MTGIIRATRTSMGVSRHDLGNLLGIGVQALSPLEIDDDRGAIKVETRERALLALAKWGIALIADAQPRPDMDAVEKDARTLAERTAWSMALSGRPLTNDRVDRLVDKFVDEGNSP